MLAYFKDPYIFASLVIFVTLGTSPIGRLLDGRAAFAGPYSAALCLAALLACVVLTIVGIRRVRVRTEG